MRHPKLTVVAVLLLLSAGCTSPENEGGTPLPSTQSGAPLQDEAIGPSDVPAEIDD